ncbi:hypothetical protein [Indioceanicola profundi]|uniref:hypothetical protein n=1 Tax=Indioceanicola profundi TaxID=2220096 RepID=UPI0013C531FC|nr:hypothetical protein [Indioceanicola profundi]
MAKTVGPAVTALGAGTAAGIWDQDAASLAWTLSLLGGAAFLLSAVAPRQAPGVVALLAAGVLAAYLAPALSAGAGSAALHEGMIAAAVAAGVAGAAAVLGASSSLTLSRWVRH